RVLPNLARGPGEAQERAREEQGGGVGLAAQKVRRASVAPDVKDLLDESDAAGLVARFSMDSTRIASALWHFIERWLAQRLVREGVTDVHVEEARFRNEPAVWFGFYLVDASGPVTVIRDAGAVVVRPDKYAVTDVVVNTDTVSPEEFVEVVKTLSSVVYSVLLALLDTLPNSPACTKSKRCLEYVMGLRWVVKNTFDRVGLYPPVDLEVYERVKDVVERGALPFSSEVAVSEEEHMKLGMGLLDVVNEVGRRVKSVEVFVPGDGREPSLRVVVPLSGLSYFELVLAVDDIVLLTIASSLFGGPYLTVSSKFSALHPHYHSAPPEAVIEVFANWFGFTVRALERAVKRLETDGGGLPPEVARAVARYLRAWLDVLSKRKNELEENKVFS
ncbi:MAG: hypothetical protein QW067_11265, partial [Thermofilaceae archaeon]